jgi:hypothetical protein
MFPTSGVPGYKANFGEEEGPPELGNIKVGELFPLQLVVIQGPLRLSYLLAGAQSL